MPIGMALPPMANQYSPGTEQWRSWEDGWAQAQQEDFIKGD